MMLNYFNELIGGLETKIGETSDGVVARKRLTLEIARLGARLYTPGQKVAWCGVLVPFDLLNAMGVTSCFVEFIGAMVASTGAADAMIEAAEQDGFASDCCSYHRTVCGAAANGLMPEPDFLIGTSAPCAGGMAVVEHLARHFKKDLFVLHIPIEVNDTAIDYLADQLREMVEFVSTRTGRTLDQDRLRAAMEYTNQVRAVWLEVNELIAKIPSPVRRRDMVNVGITLPLFLGTETAVDIAGLYRDEFARRVADGASGIANEQVRLMWLQNRIQFKNPIEKMLDEEWGAAVVAEELNEVNWQPIDPDDPYRGMAARMLSIPLCRSVEYRLENLRRMAAHYKVDGAINPCHWGCRQGSGSRGLIEEGLKSAGVPVLNLEVDCVDARHFAEGQLRTRLEAFIEMLSQRSAEKAQTR
ncbi:MAG: 2-hydroxyacyl-CoA dehydratase [Deltaproteobacteria bacterium]|nr:2-hydroxyacyl-CoA dehydratase [Deltaproteobacteria bacterium]